MIHERNNSLPAWLFFICCLVFLSLPAVVQAQQGTITLIAGDGTGPPGSTANPVLITLDNPDDRIKGLQFDLCRGPYLTLTGCSSTDRSQGINCNFDDQGNNCDRIIFIDLFGNDFIEAGTGPVITLEYDVSPNAPDPSLGVSQILDIINELSSPPEEFNFIESLLEISDNQEELIAEIEKNQENITEGFTQLLNSILMQTHQSLENTDGKEKQERQEVYRRLETVHNAVLQFSMRKNLNQD